MRVKSSILQREPRGWDRDSQWPWHAQPGSMHLARSTRQEMKSHNKPSGIAVFQKCFHQSPVFHVWKNSPHPCVKIRYLNFLLPQGRGQDCNHLVALADFHRFPGLQNFFDFWECCFQISDRCNFPLVNRNDSFRRFCQQGRKQQGHPLDVEQIMFEIADVMTADAPFVPPIAP